MSRDLKNKYQEPAQPGEYVAQVVEVSEANGTFGPVYAVKVTCADIGEPAQEIWINKPKAFTYRTSVARVYRNINAGIPADKTIGLKELNRDWVGKDVKCNLTYTENDFPVLSII